MEKKKRKNKTKPQATCKHPSLKKKPQPGNSEWESNLIVHVWVLARRRWRQEVLASLSNTVTSAPAWTILSDPANKTESWLCYLLVDCLHQMFMALRKKNVLKADYSLEKELTTKLSIISYRTLTVSYKMFICVSGIERWHRLHTGIVNPFPHWYITR